MRGAFDVDGMVSEGPLVRGDPEASKLWRRAREGGGMPPSRGSRPFAEEHRAALKAWIEAGAPDWDDD